MTDTHDRIRSLVTDNTFVLFMKGNRNAPQCGFSSKVVDVLDEYLPEYVTVDVLSDPSIREGIKEFSSWPTIPQLYVKGEFIGGCDIVTEMNDSGELEEVLGTKRAALLTPDITVTEGAIKALTEFAEGEKPVVRLEVAPGWRYGMDLDEVRPSDIVVDRDDVAVVMNRKTARKVNGMTIDFVSGPEGGGFKIDNPNEPPKVQLLTVHELDRWRKEGKSFELFDVRSPAEMETASIEGAHALDDAGIELLEKLEPDTPVAFLCHHGVRSQRAAVAALKRGFKHVYNVEGGIDAWSREIDPSVPTYG